MKLKTPLFSPEALADAAGGTTSVETPPAGTPASSVAPTVIEGDRFSIPRSEYDKLQADRVAAESTKSALEQANALREATRLLVKRAPETPHEALENATRLVMQDAGYSTAEIDSAVAALKPATPNPKSKDGMGAEVEGRLAKLETRQQEQAYNSLKNDISVSIETAISANPLINQLIDRSTEINTGDKQGTPAADAHRQELLNTLREEIDSQLRFNLGQRRAQSPNTWNNEWIKEESVKAAQAVYQKHRRFVGDPAKIGRVPETTSDALLQQKPVAEPQYQKGETFATASPKMRAWALDQLVRSDATANAGNTI